MTTLAEDLGTAMTAESPLKPAAPTDGAGSVPSVQLLALALLDDNPANRGGHELGDVDELAESIRLIGLLQPILVEHAPGGRYRIIAGHRRRKACLAAGMAAAHCSIREDLMGETAIAARLIENLHREDLTALEEAAGFKELVDLRHSQRAIAKMVGKSQAHVSKRLALLELPEPVIAAFLADDITLEEARALRPIADEPDRIEKVLEDHKRWGAHQYGAVEKLVADQVDEIDRATKLAELRADIEGAGKTWLGEIGWENRFENYPLHGSVTLAEHRPLACHAWGVLPDSTELIECCKSPRSHKPAPSGSTAPTQPVETPAQKRARVALEKKQAAEKAKRELQEQRLTAVVTGKPSKSWDAFIDGICLRRILDERDCGRVLKYLGITLDEDECEEDALEAYAAKGTTQLRRVLLADAVVAGRQHWATDPEKQLLHAFLEANGLAATS